MRVFQKTISVEKRTSGMMGAWTPPADKSISHRALLIASLAEGKSSIYNCLQTGDVLSTLNALRALGIKIEKNEKEEALIYGKGLYGFKAPLQTLDVGNSGTTLRLLTAILSAQCFSSTLTGDSSLRRRPMKLLITALRDRGAHLFGTEEERAPITIHKPYRQFSMYCSESPQRSAQFKSGVLLSGLYAEGPTYVYEKIKTRDHTERMLHHAGIFISEEKKKIELHPGKVTSISVSVPGDLSSAAFIIALALLTPHSKITIRSVGLNSTRTGFLDVIKKMGGNIEIYVRRGGMHLYDEEPSGDIEVQFSSLKATNISDILTIRSIDEIPLIALLATQAEGKTVISHAGMLREKESDRLWAVATVLKSLGAFVEETEDGLIIEGPTRLYGKTVESFSDHRMAMLFVIAGLIAEGKTEVKGAEWIDISFPGFLNAVHQ